MPRLRFAAVALAAAVCVPAPVAARDGDWWILADQDDSVLAADADSLRPVGPQVYALGVVVNPIENGRLTVAHQFSHVQVDCAGERVRILGTNHVDEHFQVVQVSGEQPWTSAPPATAVYQFVCNGLRDEPFQPAPGFGRRLIRED